MSEMNQPQQFNGINALTGDYGLKLSAQQLVERVFGAADQPDRVREHQKEFALAVKDAQKEVTRNVREGIDGADLTQAGWGVIFAHADPNLAAIQEALAPLLALRKAQAKPYRLFTGPDAYRPEETKSAFLRRFNIGAGAVDPKKGVPYYLLLIGSPELIPFEFQYQLDVQFAVGRLDFATLDEYAHYANAVVAAETGQRQLAPQATFFSVVNPDDTATANTDRWLMQPLTAALSATPGWAFTSYQGQEANRTQLLSLLGGAAKPALLFTASHGIEFPAGHPQQESHQGALLCSDWPGPQRWQGALREEFYVAGDHLTESADPSGMIAFHFACFGGGTPRYYDFERFADRTLAPAGNRQPIAARAFVANLPQRLLGHPKGGALAVVSHVDRAWSYSYRQGDTPQTAVFEDTLTRLFQGQPLGWALEFFNNRYAELAADLSNELNRLRGNPTMQPYEIATLWTENHDARNYVVLGDPAVRVAVSTSQAPGMVASQLHRPPAIIVYDDGRPLTVSKDDWAMTPPTVKAAFATAVQQVNQLTAAVQQSATAPVRRPDVRRDGGRSSGGPVRSAATRGGALRGGDNRGTTRSWQPPADDEEPDR